MMNGKRNFDELMAEIAGLGIDAREVSGAVANAISSGAAMKAASYRNGPDRIVLDLGRDDNIRLSLFNYCIYRSIGNDSEHVQAFEPDVPLQDAKRLLEARIAKGVGESMDCYIPLFLRDVQQELKSLNPNIMNTQNAEFLKKSLLNLGFGEKLNDALLKEMEAKTPEFTLALTHEFNKKEVDYTLHFKGGENQEMYFFNKYDVSIRNTDGVQGDASQTFYINKGSGVTAKEAFNLMEGRAVHKQLFNLEGERYNAWIALDDKNLTDGGNMKMKHFHENYGFDLEKVLSGKGIKEMEDTKGKEDLLYSLKKGNAQQVTIGDNKYYVTANPQFKTIDLFDSQMKKVKREDILKPEAKPANEQTKSEQQKEVLPAKKPSRRKGMSV